MTHRPDLSSLIGKDPTDVPMSCQRVMKSSAKGEMYWIGPKEAVPLSSDEQTAYDAAHTIIRHMIVQAPAKHSSGHPGGPLSAFGFSYLLGTRRDPAVDQPYRMSAGHLSVLGYTLQWLLGRGSDDERLASPQTIIDTFRTPNGLPGHIEAGIGDIPFGTGPLGKGVSNALGAAYGLKLQKKPGKVDVLLADGDAQEGQVMEAFRLASHLNVDNLIVHGDFNDIQLSNIASETFAADFAHIAHSAGWNVIEVQNGNDPAQINAALNAADSLVGKGRPIFVCYYTTMGSGISFMEQGSNTGEKNYHGAPLSGDEVNTALAELPDFSDAIDAYLPFREKRKAQYDKGHVETDIALNNNTKGYKRSVTGDKGAARKDFGATHIAGLMAADDRIVVLHADLAGSGGFDVVEKAFPDRVLNVGVAEANMYMMAAGMRQTGLIPVTYTFAAFGMNEARANARLIDINCGHTRCGILNDCTHAGLSVGEDGETHQEQNYLNIPFHHTKVWMPVDSNQAAAMAEKAVDVICEGHNSVYVFSPRSSHEQVKTPNGDIVFDTDYTYDEKMTLVRGNGDTTDHATILACGTSVQDAIVAADMLAASPEKISVRVLAVSSLRPIDSSAILQAAFETQHLIVVEDHNIDGGLATIVSDVIADFGLPCTLRRLGMTQYLPSGPANDLKIIAGLDSDSIADAVQDEVRTEVCGGEDAFVSAVYELVHNSTHSRFAETAKPYIQKLVSEKGYLSALRSYASSKSCEPDKMPSTDELIQRLEQIT